MEMEDLQVKILFIIYEYVSDDFDPSYQFKNVTDEQMKSIQPKCKKITIMI